MTDRAKRDAIVATAERNVSRMTETLGKLVALSRSAEGAENALIQRVELAAMVTEVISRLRGSWARAARDWDARS